MAGADLGFSRRWAAFQKFQKTVFLVNQFELQRPLKALKRPCMGQFSCVAGKFLKIITRPNSALDRRTILCLYVPGFQRQVFKHDKFLSERSTESKD